MTDLIVHDERFRELAKNTRLMTTWNSGPQFKKNECERKGSETNESESSTTTGKESMR